MSGEAVPLSVAPAALISASGIIDRRAGPLAAPSSPAPTAMETAGQAGAAVDRAINAYCAAFAQRLSTVAFGLDEKASAYTSQEAANYRAMAAIPPER